MNDEIQAQVVLGKLNGKNPNCFYCQHANVIGGNPGSMYEPPEPDEAECTCEDSIIDELLQDYDYDQLPGLCGHFEPHVIELCGFCGRPMNVPEYLSQYQAYDSIYANDPIHVCSKECQDAIDGKFQQEQLEEERLNNEYQELQARWYNEKEEI